MKKFIFKGDRYYLRGCTEFEVDGINICSTTIYTPEENGRAERINRTLRNAVLDDAHSRRRTSKVLS